jgi:hypothetical protein
LSPGHSDLFKYKDRIIILNTKSQTSTSKADKTVPKILIARESRESPREIVAVTKAVLGKTNEYLDFVSRRGLKEGGENTNQVISK